jgi:hypothetical protein
MAGLVAANSWRDCASKKLDDRQLMGDCLQAKRRTCLYGWSFGRMAESCADPGGSQGRVGLTPELVYHGFDGRGRTRAPMVDTTHSYFDMHLPCNLAVFNPI